MRIDRDNPKCDRALALHEKGLSHEAISIRLGIRMDTVNRSINQGRARRERKAMAREAE